MRVSKKLVFRTVWIGSAGHQRKVAQIAPAGDLKKIVKPLWQWIIFSIAHVYAGSSGVTLRNFTLVAVNRTGRSLCNFREEFKKVMKSFVARAQLPQIQTGTGSFVGVAPSRRRLLDPGSSGLGLDRLP